MRTHRFLTGLAAALLVAAVTATPTRADTAVFSDSGALGTFKFTNNGGNVFSLDLTPVSEQRLENINDLSVGTGGLPADFGSTLNFTLVSSGGGGYTFTSDPFTKIFRSIDDGGRDASLNYEVQGGLTGAATPNGLLLTGPIVSAGSTGTILDFLSPPSGAALPAGSYDFASMVGGTITFALTSSSFGGGADSFADVLSGSQGAFATGGFSAFSQAPVPEPASLAIVSVSLAGLLAYRRYGGKRAQAA